jgi:glutamate synthase domain-containing protein 3
MTTFDLKDNSVRELNHALHQDSAEGAEFIVSNPNGKHSVAVGAMYHSKVTVDGHAGYYCAGMNQHADIVINGNAGSGCAENIMSGTVRVKGNVSQYCAATGHGGLVVVEGDASSRCGISMKGVNIVVGGSIGNLSAFMAQSGCLVVCGDAGEALGDSAYEARFYIGGKVASLGADCVEKPMQDEHREQLRQLLEAAGMGDVDISGFRRYGSARRLYNFNIDHAGEY